MEFSPIFLQKIILTLLAVYHEYPGKPGAESNCRQYIYGEDAGADKSPESVTLLSALAFQGFVNFVPVSSTATGFANRG
jgi:hypothetical protein